MDVQLSSVVGIGWLIFFAYWGISALSAKRNVRRRSWVREVGVRLVLIAVIVAFARQPNSRAFFQDRASAPIQSIQGVASLILCLAGFALAVWARQHLGRNWGMPMTLKEGHELVTTGPYGYVRHPIYTGMLLAMLGSALVGGRVWLVVLVLMVGYCLYSAWTEERIMTQQFPQQYPQYKRQTKALVPFVL